MWGLGGTHRHRQEFPPLASVASYGSCYPAFVSRGRTPNSCQRGDQGHRIKRLCQDLQEAILRKPFADVLACVAGRQNDRQMRQPVPDLGNQLVAGPVGQADVDDRCGELLADALNRCKCLIEAAGFFGLQTSHSERVHDQHANQGFVVDDQNTVPRVAFVPSIQQFPDSRRQRGKRERLAEQFDPGDRAALMNEDAAGISGGDQDL